MEQNIPVGISDFREIRENGYYYIDKTGLIRELLKPLPETERSSLEAKVPAVKRRTSCVYADLRKLYVEVNNLKAG